MKWKGRRLLAMAFTGILLAGCGAAGQVDDYATNEGSTQEASTKTTGTESGGISKDKIKVGVLHLSPLCFRQRIFSIHFGTLASRDRGRDNTIMN